MFLCLATSCSSVTCQNPLFRPHNFPIRQDKAGIHQSTTTIRSAYKTGSICKLRYAIQFTFSFQSVPDLYGDLNGFLDRFPADKLELFRQSKNLSNISAKRAVCDALSPTNKSSPLATELLRTYMYACIQMPSITITHKAYLLVQQGQHSSSSNL